MFTDAAAAGLPLDTAVTFTVPSVPWKASKPFAETVAMAGLLVLHVTPLLVALLGDIDAVSCMGWLPEAFQAYWAGAFTMVTPVTGTSGNFAVTVTGFAGRVNVTESALPLSAGERPLDDQPRKVG